MTPQPPEAAEPAEDSTSASRRAASDPTKRAVSANGSTPAPGTAAERREDTSVGGVQLTSWTSWVGRWIAKFGHRIGDWLGPYAALVITLAIGAAITTALTFLAAAVYDAVTDEDGVAGIDRPVLDAILTIRDPTANAFVTGFTDLAGPIGMPIVAVVALLILSIRRRSWTPAVLIVATGIGALLMTVAGKVLIGRDRPPIADAVPPYEVSASFPSGHTLNAVAILGVIAYLLILRRESALARAAIVTVVVIATILVAASRVYLGHHWVTDVIAGWLLGAAWLALVITAHRIYLTVRVRREEPTAA